MAKSKFDSLTPEEVQALTGKKLDAYNKYILAQAGATDKAAPDAPAAPKQKADSVDTAKIAADFFEGNPDFQHDSVLVLSNGTVYANTPRGANAAINFQKDRAAAGIEVTIHTHKK